MTTSAAPRESASKQSAPVPAKRSRQCAPAMYGASQLKSVSRTRSGVGRNPCAANTGSRRPRQRPPMMRIAPGYEVPAAFALLLARRLTGAATDVHHGCVVGMHVALERGANLIGGYRLDVCDVRVEVVERQSVERDG